MTEKRCPKVRYSTKAEADADALWMRHNARNRRNRLNGVRLRAYECPICEGFHLTGQSRARDKKIKRHNRRLTTN